MVFMMCFVSARGKSALAGSPLTLCVFIYVARLSLDRIRSYLV